MRERERKWERQREQVPTAQTSPQTAGRSESLAGILTIVEGIAGTTPESLFMFPSMKYLVDTKIVRHCHCRRLTTISDPMRIQ